MTDHSLDQRAEAAARDVLTAHAGRSIDRDVLAHVLASAVLAEVRRQPAAGPATPTDTDPTRLRAAAAAAIVGPGRAAEAELYVLLRKAGEDRYEAQALIDRHRDEVLRRLADEAQQQPAAEVVHGCPPDGSGLTPCCGRTPFELPLGDRISSEAPTTCRGPAVQQPAAADDEETPFVPPAHYRGRDGTAYCVHAIPVGPGSCGECRGLATP